MQKIYFVFPVYNEALNIAKVLTDLDQLEAIVSNLTNNIKFIFVNDGSTDETLDYLSSTNRKNLHIVSHSYNMGPGQAFQTAFDYLLRNGLEKDDLVITLEGDATSDPNVLRRMLTRSMEGDDIILASPYIYGGGFSDVKAYRVFLSHCVNFLLKLFFNLRGIATFSCFFRIYRGSALQKLDKKYNGKIVTCKGFDCAAEILVKAVHTNLSISEVPFRVDWSRRKGKSKLKTVRTMIDYVKLFYKFSRRKEKFE